MGVGDWGEMLQEAEQAVGSGVFRHIVRHPPEQWLGIGFHHRYLEEQRGIESGIGVFLEGEYPFLLTASHRRPALYGLFGRSVAVFVVTHYAAQQPGVGGRYPVVVVDAECGQCRDIHLENLVGGYFRCQLRVKSMYALHNQHVVGIEPEGALLVHAPSEFEAVCGEVYFLTVQQGLQIVVEQVKVESVQRLVVIFSILVEGCLVAVHEIIVERDQLGGHEIGHELYGEAL